VGGPGRVRYGPSVKYHRSGRRLAHCREIEDEGAGPLSHPTPARITVSPTGRAMSPTVRPSRRSGASYVPEGRRKPEHGRTDIDTSPNPESGVFFHLALPVSSAGQAGRVGSLNERPPVRPPADDERPSRKRASRSGRAAVRGVPEAPH